MMLLKFGPFIHSGVGWIYIYIYIFVCPAIPSCDPGTYEINERSERPEENDGNHWEIFFSPGLRIPVTKSRWWSGQTIGAMDIYIMMMTVRRGKSLHSVKWGFQKLMIQERVRDSSMREARGNPRENNDQTEEKEAPKSRWHHGEQRKRERERKKSQTDYH